MPTYQLGSSALVHAPGLIAWAINGYAFPRDRDAILCVVVDTWPTLANHDARLLLSGECPYRIEGDTVVFSIADGIPAEGTTHPKPDSGKHDETEYLVKVRFWLRAYDCVTVYAASDEKALERARLAAADLMTWGYQPDEVEIDERREGLISYIDRIDDDGEHTEIIDALDFEGDRPLFPEIQALLAKIAALDPDMDPSTEGLRDVIASLVTEARKLCPSDAPVTLHSPQS